MGIPTTAFTVLWALSPYVRRNDTIRNITRSIRAFRYNAKAQRQGLEALLFRLNQEEAQESNNAVLTSAYEHGGVDACVCAMQRFPKDTELQHLAFAVLFKLASLPSAEEQLQNVRKPNIRELCLSRAREHLECADCVKGAVLLYARLTEKAGAGEVSPHYLPTLKRILKRYAKLGEVSGVHLQVVTYTCATFFSYIESLNSITPAELKLLPLVLDVAIANTSVEQLQVVIFGTLYKVAHLYDVLEEAWTAESSLEMPMDRLNLKSTYREAERGIAQMAVQNGTLLGLMQLIQQTKLFKQEDKSLAR